MTEVFAVQDNNANSKDTQEKKKNTYTYRKVKGTPDSSARNISIIMKTPGGNRHSYRTNATIPICV